MHGATMRFVFIFVCLPKSCAAAENVKSSGRTRVDERDLEQFLRSSCSVISVENFTHMCIL